MQPCSSLQPMKRQDISPWIGWKFFSERSSDGYNRCLVPGADGRECGVSLKYSNTTHNFKKHLEGQSRRDALR